MDLAAFRTNLAAARRMAGTPVMAVLKADAYGHGALPLAREAVSLGCPIIGVATVAEGAALRRGGIGTDILVLGGVPAGLEGTALEHDLAAVLYDLGDADRLARAAGSGRIRVHLKVDTGMGRLGFMPADFVAACRRVTALPALQVEGIMTHYARADEADPEPTIRQAALFDEALAAARDAGLQARWVHARNSAALLLQRGPRYTLARPGIMLYGSLPSPDFPGREGDYGLRPVLELRARVCQLREVPDGWPVSYGGRWRARGRRAVAVLAAGYADGFLRYNTGGEVLLRGRRAPVVGTVCMDMCMADVTGIEGVVPGEEAVLIGRQGVERILAADVARRGGTISYEVFCGLSPRVERVLTEGGEEG